MTIEVKVPVLPESVEDATIATWHKKPGDTVHRDDNLVDLETDKVVLEVPAPVDGTVKEIRVEQGTTVHSNDVIAVIEEGAVEKKAAPEETVPVPAPAPPSDTDRRIEAVQAFLAELGYAPGSIDGRMSSSTKRATRSTSSAGC